MSSRNKKNKAPKQQQATSSPGNQIELIGIPTAPKRDGFSMSDFRAAIKQAENVENPSRIKLLDYYNDIMLDLHLTAVVEKRRHNIKSTKFIFVDENGRFNEAIDNLINTPFWRKMLSDFIDAKFFGFTAGWLDLSGGQFHKYKLLPRKHIIPEKSLFLIKQTDRGGINYKEGLYPNYIITSGDVDDFGLLMKAIPWVLLKRGDISDWATFNELYAMPFRLGKYPQYDMVAKKALAEACQDSASNGFAIIPNTTDLTFIQSQVGSSTTAYENFAAFCDKQLSKGFVLNTMTLDAEGGQYKGLVHEDSEKGVYASDRMSVLDILNTDFLKLLELHGFNPGNGYFSIQDEDHLCLTERILIDKELDLHIDIPVEYWYSKYGIPLPKGGAKAKVDSNIRLRNGIDEQFAQLHDQLQAVLTEQDNRPMYIDTRKKGFFD